MRTTSNTFSPQLRIFLFYKTYMTFLLIFFLSLFSKMEMPGQDVLIQDRDKNVLMRFNDEGSTGSITFFPTTSTFSDQVNKLYNFEGDLYWERVKIGTANEAAGWRFSSPNLTLLDNAHKVGIGTSTPLGKLHILQTSKAFALRVDDALDDTSPFIIDDAGNVGIGTANPGQKLEVAGKLKLGNDGVAESSGVMRFNTVTDEFEGFNGTSWISFGGGGKWLSNGRKIYYDQGYVGIGNINPGYPLEVTRTNTSDNNTPIATFKSEGFNSAGSLRVENSVGNYWVLGTLQDPDNSLSFNYKSNNILSGNTFKVTPQGNVGIGTANPEQKLEVVGKLKLGNDVVAESSGVMRFNDETDEFEGFNGTSWISFGGGGKWLSNSSDIYFNTGNVGIGSASPLAKFYIIQKSTSDAFRVDDESGDDTPFIIKADGDVGIGTSSPSYPLHAIASNVDRTGYFEIDTDTDFASGVYGSGSGTGPVAGTYGRATGVSSNYGIVGLAFNGNINYGGKFTVNTTMTTHTGYGIHATATGTGTNFAGYFEDGDVILENGEMGVGTLDPSAKMHVIQEEGGVDAFRVDDEASDTSPFIIKSNGAIGSGTEIPQAKMHIIEESINDAFRVDDEASDTSPLIVKDDGDVGIGLTDPSTKLHIVQEGSDDAFRVDDQNSDTSPFIIKSNGKVGIGTQSPHTSAKVEMESTSEGILIPRMSEVQRDAIATPATGLLIYQTNNNPGFYSYDGEKWKPMTVQGTGENDAGEAGIGNNYGTIVNNITGKVWLDRNLGATRVATSSTDADAYGDLYQWGRGADGHQLRTSPTESTLATNWLSGGNSWDGKFLTVGIGDWLFPEKLDLWSGTTAENNPCPSGFRLPTNAEWNQERLTWSSNDAAGAFASPLKLTVNGYRDPSVGLLLSVGSNGYYWSSTIEVKDNISNRLLFIGSDDAHVGFGVRSAGATIRCIKD